ncbi:MAG TPA: type IV secretion system protein [Allosphingosinicella sp.]|nr:type IV secretion system protein [Allosphingosinicella sp.]
MIGKKEYFERAESWGISAQQGAARSQRIAWTAAGIVAAIAVFEAVALAMLLPLKTVQPVTLLVDRHTGYVQALDPVQQKRLAADDALTQSFLAQYVTAREGFDRATVSTNYRRVALWSAGPARTTYLSQMPATHPASPFQQYAPGAVGVVRVKSVSRLDQGTALVRFDTQRQDQNGGMTAPQPWISVVKYRYTDAPMSLEDRLVNPMGFQVVSYRRDAEAPQPAAVALTASTVDSAAGSAIAPASAAEGMENPARARALRPRPPASRQESARPPSYGRTLSRREVPANQLPLGSPLSPGNEVTRPASPETEL